jgi:ParB family chromosome partitioning protein
MDEPALLELEALVTSIRARIGPGAGRSPPFRVARTGSAIIGAVTPALLRTATSTGHLRSRVAPARALGHNGGRAAGEVAMPSWAVPGSGEPPEEVVALAGQVERDGGRALAVYQDPVGNHWHIFCVLPLDRVEATPYQRDLSPAHVKRLQEVVRKIDRFVDPIVVMSPAPGRYWTPNGNHRRTVLVKLKAREVPAILVPDPGVAFQILALNTEKAHNLKEKSLEVIRMYRGLAEGQPERGEEDYAFQFEAPHFVTLGILYERNKRFSGGAFAPMLRRVDKFLKGAFPRTLPLREKRADQVAEADAALATVVAKLRKRGINHPYVKNFVLSRATPLTRARKTLPSFEATFAKLTATLAEFDVARVRYEDVQRAAVVVPAAGD